MSRSRRYVSLKASGSRGIGTDVTVCRSLEVLLTAKAAHDRIKAGRSSLSGPVTVQELLDDLQAEQHPAADANRLEAT